jgi:hypothetical protein
MWRQKYRSFNNSAVIRKTKIKKAKEETFITKKQD